MFVDDVNNARRHSDGEQLEGQRRGPHGPYRWSDTAPAANSGSHDHRTPMSTFEKLRRHEAVRPRLGALVYFKPVLTYKCNLLVIGNNA